MLLNIVAVYVYLKVPSPHVAVTVPTLLPSAKHKIQRELHPVYGCHSHQLHVSREQI